MAEDVFEVVGRVIADGYHVDGVVAEGSLAVVYRAHRVREHTPVALKLLPVTPSDARQQSAFLQAFQRQTEFLLRLSSRSATVVRTLLGDTFTTGAGRLVPYWVLEWLDGVTLDVLVARRTQANLPPVPLRKWLRLLTPVARALESAHHFGGREGESAIVHGDLKPRNLFIAQHEGAEVIKILGFGGSQFESVVKRLAGKVSPESGVALGNPSPHSAPEQWAPSQWGQIGPWTDVWGLALSLVELMHGSPVIEGESTTMMAIACDPLRRPTPRSRGIEVSDAVEAVFARALALDPRARPKHAGVFWNELAAALEEPRSVSAAVALAADDDLEFDPSSGKQPVAPVRADSAFRDPRAGAPRVAVPAFSSPTVSDSTPPAVSSARHVVPDLELTPAPISRRFSEEQAASPGNAAEPRLIELDSTPMPVALGLDLDLPAAELRPRRTASSQSLAATRPSEPSPPHEPRIRNAPPRSLSGAMAALNEPLPSSPTSGVMPTRAAAAELTFAVPPRAPARSRPPPSADMSAPFEASFVAKIEPQSAAERSLAQRLKPALVLLAAAISIAVLDPVYAAAFGEVLLVLGLRLSLFAGALLVLALFLGVRELLRE